MREIHLADELSAPPPLTPHEIHVWHGTVDRSAEELSELREPLSEDEHARAQRFRFQKDRNNFIVSRGTLRTLLGAYLGKEPQDLRFQYSDFGQPLLAEDDVAERVRFNVSHSGGVVLWAFGQVRRIGVDVEQVRRDFGTLEIAERFFSEAERQMLRQLPADQRHEAFFRCWTRKESFIKALGEGLSHPLNQFDVSLGPGDAPRLLATRPDHNEARRWQMWDLSVPSSYSATLIAELK